MASGIRYDSIFLGIKFGMSQKDFYTHCWELNKQGLILQGPSNLSVQYRLDTTLMRSDTYMWFYPDFQDGELNRMPVEFSYLAWAPWNPMLSSDSLLMDVKQLLERWYGSEFIYLENKDKTKKLWVMVMGNRRIRLFIKNASTVGADITDLYRVKNEN
ncbi:MAG: hypothetical protein KF725_06420 [Cyclobacteriaceae bacterium]|nr:hypothetical protein [Cyclobacteriaceae bacterium]